MTHAEIAAQIVADWNEQYIVSEGREWIPTEARAAIAAAIETALDEAVI